MAKIPILVIGGPTASGKTALAVALARRFGGEIVSADSMQLYKYLSIGTARASKEELLGVPIHLSGFLELSEEYSAARFVSDSSAVIEDIYNRGNLPVVCGGTGLYISSLIDNISFSGAAPDRRLREELSALSEQILLDELARVDPESAARLCQADKKRIVRALEIYRLTGITMTEHNRLSKITPSPYEICYFCIGFRDRKLLYDRIEQRVDLMMKKGLADEAKFILEHGGVGTVMQAIGYKEFIPYFNGECPLEESVERLKTDTRRYAKRQLTWFRRDERVKWLFFDDYESFDRLQEDAVRLFEETGVWKL